jgi:PAS domain S-box-containing protein
LNGRVAPTVLFLESPDTVPEHDRLRAAGCEIVIALGRRDQLLGVIALGPRRSGDPYFARDIAFIESLAELASVALENSYLYQRQVELLEYSDRLLESLDAAVIVVDVSGKLTSFNAAAIRLLGLPSDAIGARLEILPHEIGWALALSLVQARPHREIEVAIDNASRGLLPVMVSAAPMHTHHDVTGAFAVVTDLSTVKALERNQRRMDRLSSMARFYAGLAHEIRTPLASISTFISMLPDRYDDAEYRDTAARLLPLEVNRIVQLADRLRFMAPSEGAKLHPVDVTTVLQDMVSLQVPRATDGGIVISVVMQPALPLIHGDPSQLTQLFLNLVKNAMEAMPTGGTITIEARRVAIGTTRTGVRVRIVDEGSGVDSRMSGKIFEPFFTTKPQGTGLGLSICREIADFHNARLSVTRRVDGHPGSMAEIIFPADESELTHTQTLQASIAR